MVKQEYVKVTKVVGANAYFELFFYQKTLQYLLLEVIVTANVQVLVSETALVNSDAFVKKCSPRPRWQFHFYIVTLLSLTIHGSIHLVDGVSYKIVSGFQPLTIFAKCYNLDVEQGSEYTSGVRVSIRCTMKFPVVLKRNACSAVIKYFFNLVRCITRLMRQPKVKGRSKITTNTWQFTTQCLQSSLPS